VSNVIKRFFPSSLKGRLHWRNALKTNARENARKSACKNAHKKNGIVHQAKNARKNATKMPPKCHQNACKMLKKMLTTATLD
jgi:hypothetical protein